MSGVKTARKLRQSQTEAEYLFWTEVRNRQFMKLKWRRQAPIDRYVVDFVCEQEKLIVELDGSQHMDTKDYDENRTQVLEHYGYRVLRFWNEDVFENLNEVFRIISQNVGGTNSPHPAAPSARGPFPKERT